MSPAQFATQCVANWKRKKELTHIAKVCDAKASSEIRGKPSGEACNQCLPICCALLSALLVNNALADLPIRLNHRKVNGGIGLVASGVEN